MRYGILEKNIAGQYCLLDAQQNMLTDVTGTHTPFLKSGAGIFDFIVFPVDLPKTAIFEISIPAKIRENLLHSTLEMELENKLPIPIEQVSWGYFKHPKHPDKIILYVFDQQMFDSFVATIKEQDIVCDLIFPSFLLNDREYDKGVCLNSYFNEIKLNRNVVPVSAFVPKELHPQRNRSLKFTRNLFLIAAVILFAVMIVKEYQIYQKELNILKKERILFANELKLLQAEANKLATDHETWSKIQDAKIEDIATLAVLNELSKRLPDTMWVTSFIQTGKTANLVINSQKDDSNLHRILTESQVFQVLNSTKERNSSDGTVRFGVSLRGVN